jgi:tRNA A-37 threonylcarbamoyl transferase component Bud32
MSIPQNDVSRIVSRFENAWQSGPTPDLDAFVPAHDAAHRHSVLIELVLVDLEHQWKAGHPALTQDYLERFPELTEDAEFVRELLLYEMQWRHRFTVAPLVAGQTGEAFGTEIQTPDQQAVAARISRQMGVHPQVPGYEVMEKLGKGGMGVVYRARQKKLNRVVALKMILDGAHADAEQRRRFLSEAEAVARLQHPNVVMVHEVGQYRDEVFLAMEYVAGSTLAAHCDSKPQEPRWCAEIVEVLARAVHHVHEKGVIHRDLKPGNVMLAKDGSPSTLKVMDFGLARQVDIGHSMTATGAVMGTPSFMAPEQARGQSHHVTAVVDVWALGAILYALLTGRPPFLAATSFETLQQVVHGEPVPIRRLQPSVASDLETICLKCLDKDPTRRYGSAGDVADDLQRFLRHEPIRARPVGLIERCWKWYRRNLVRGTLLGVIGLLVIMGVSVTTGLLMRADELSLRAQQEVTLRMQEEDLRKEREAAAKAEKQLRRLAQAEEAKAKEQEALKQRALFVGQLNRVSAVFQSEPIRARELLFDVHACPIPLRESAWHFYERATARREVARFEGHDKRITSVAFSPTGDRVYAWDRDGKARAWSLADRLELAAVEPPEKSSDLQADSPDRTVRAEVRGNNVVLRDRLNQNPMKEREEQLALQSIKRQRWHQEQATRAEQDSNWQAAEFHLRQLLKSCADDADLRRRHLVSVVKLQPTRPMSPLPRPE